MLAQPSARPWADSETEGALDAFAAGERITDIAADLERDYEDVEAHLKARGAARYEHAGLPENLKPRGGGRTRSRELREHLRGERVPRLHRLAPVRKPDIPPRDWPPEELEWARECHRAGDTVGEIAKWAHRSREDVAQALQGEEQGPGNRSNPKPEVRMPPRRSDLERDAEILTLTAAGVCPRDIIAIFARRNVTLTRSTIAGVRHRDRQRWR